MSKKAVQFDETSGENRLKEKNTLDSDDEDAKETTEEILNDEDIEGQEDATIDRDGEIQITPFNLKDEMDEGHFDRDGTFVFDKKSEIKDNWIDNVDWVKVADEKHRIKKTCVNDTTEELTNSDYIQAYTGMLELLKPGETVLKCVRRLGASKTSQSASQRWSKKKQTASKNEDKDSKVNSENMLRLTEYADKIIQDGNMDIYEATYEKITFMLNKLKEPEKKLLACKDDDEALDMFAESLDEERGVKRKLDDSEKVETKNTESDEVSWMYKWENTGESELLGPVSSSQMLAWCEGDYFSKGAYCRKVNTEGDYYNVNRIDFDLYT